MIVALSLLGSVFLSATANGIAMFMLYGAGIVAGLLGTIGAALNAHTVQTVAHVMSLALPFEGLYRPASTRSAPTRAGSPGCSSTSVRSAHRMPGASDSISGRSRTRASSAASRRSRSHARTSDRVSPGPSRALVQTRSEERGVGRPNHRYLE